MCRMSGMGAGKTRLYFLLLIGMICTGCASTGWTYRDEPNAYPSYRKVGHITVEKDIQNLLFKKTPEERRNELYAEALRIVTEQYGRDAILANVYVAADWSPLSLLMGMNALGFVEKGILRADVLVSVPEPEEPKPLPEPEVAVVEEPEPEDTTEPDPVVEEEPEPEAEPEIEEEPVEEEPPVLAVQTVQTHEGQISVSYNIEPIVRHEDEFGYIEIEYLQPDEVKEWLDARLEELRAEPEDYEYAYKTITDGGQIHVHVARQDQLHGNTKWYTFEILQGKKVLDVIAGEEEPPNKQDDFGNWWANVPISLKNPIAESINVRVIDRRADRIYSFKISRTETVE